jgi:hypothetical protein
MNPDGSETDLYRGTLSGQDRAAHQRFVDCFLEGPFLEKLRVAGQAIEFRLKAGQRDDSAFLPGVSQAKKEIELGYKEIDSSYPQHQPFVAWPIGCQQRQKGLGQVLPSPGIISPGRQGNQPCSPEGGSCGASGGRTPPRPSALSHLFEALRHSAGKPGLVPHPGKPGRCSLSPDLRGRGFLVFKSH